MTTNTAAPVHNKMRPDLGAKHPTLCRLRCDVVNTTKRDRRMTRDWRHAEKWVEGMLLVVSRWHGDDTQRQIGPLDGYSHERALECTDHENGAALFALLMPHLDLVREDSIGALLVHYDGGAESVLATLLNRNPDLRAAVVECFRIVDAEYNAPEDSALDLDLRRVRRSEVLS